MQRSCLFHPTFHCCVPRVFLTAPSRPLPWRPLWPTRAAAAFLKTCNRLTTIAEISNGKRRTSVCKQRHDRTRYGEDIGIPIRKANQLQAKWQAVIFEHRE